MNVEILLDCPFCGKSHTVVAPWSGYSDWRAGVLIQNALPSLSPTEREQLVSHLCPACQREIFGE